jgi:hypothetical protein
MRCEDPSRHVCISWCGKLYFDLLGYDISTLKMGVAVCSDMSPTTYQTALYHNPKDLSLNNKKMIFFYRGNRRSPRNYYPIKEKHGMIWSISISDRLSYVLDQIYMLGMTNFQEGLPSRGVIKSTPTECFVNQYGISVLYRGEVIHVSSQADRHLYSHKETSACLSIVVLSVSNGLCVPPTLFPKTKLANRKIASKPWSQRLGHPVSLL